MGRGYSCRAGRLVRHMRGTWVPKGLNPLAWSGRQGSPRQALTRRRSPVQIWAGPSTSFPGGSVRGLGWSMAYLACLETGGECGLGPLSSTLNMRENPQGLLEQEPRLLLGVSHPDRRWLRRLPGFVPWGDTADPCPPLPDPAPCAANPSPCPTSPQENHPSHPQAGRAGSRGAADDLRSHVHLHAVPRLLRRPVRLADVPIALADGVDSPAHESASSREARAAGRTP